MKTSIFRRNECEKAVGLCVVIDVLRAFTTAAFAFSGGAKEIILVSTLEEAFKKHHQDQSLILMGEQEGKLIEGFHYGNSPKEIQQASVSGRRLVQRTSSGTQGVVRCSHAQQMLISSFVVAEATLKRISELNPAHVSFIVTGRVNGDEDLALAEYLQSRLLKQKVSIGPFLDRVRNSPAALRMTSGDYHEYKYGNVDLELAIQADRFAFAMEVSKNNGDLIARRV